MSINTIKATYTEHHTARARRYISRKSEGVAEAYTGKFGAGYIIYTPRMGSLPARGARILLQIF